VSSTTIALAAIPVAVVAVVLSTGGMSLGLTKEAKGEVEVLTIATGSFTTPAQYPDSIAISNTCLHAGGRHDAPGPHARVDGDLPSFEGRPASSKRSSGCPAPPMAS
jgi:hypothetical protein